jgi:hypothetical protein
LAVAGILGRGGHHPKRRKQRDELQLFGIQHKSEKRLNLIIAGASKDP